MTCPSKRNAGQAPICQATKAIDSRRARAFAFGSRQSQTPMIDSGTTQRLDGWTTKREL